MKKIFKKNQIVITALAALIAVAGYLNHIEKSERELKETVEEPSSEENDGNQSADKSDINSNELDINSEPGEAVFVNAQGTVDFVVEAKLLREQTRANSKAMLMEIVNNTNLSEEERRKAVDKISDITDKQEREMAAENLISSKGFQNVVVTITDDEVDVMVVSESLDNAKRAQIEEIVKNKTNVPADKITITAVKTN